MRDAVAREAPLDELLGRIAGQDRAAFRALYADTAPKLFGLALRILHDRGAAEDAVQEAFMDIWRQASGYDPARGAAFPWLAAIVRNRAIDALRRDGRNPAARNPIDLDALAPLAAPDAGGSIELMALVRCLDELAPEVQKLILMAYLEGRSRDELAERSGRPVNTIKTWLRRGLQGLRDCMET